MAISSCTNLKAFQLRGLSPIKKLFSALWWKFDNILLLSAFLKSLLKIGFFI